MTTSSRGGLGRRAFLLGGAAAATAVVVGCGSGESASTTTSAAGDAAATSASTTSSTAASVAATSATSATTSTPPDDATTQASGTSEFVVRGSGDDDVVALTFHTNGDLRLAQQLVDVMRRHDAVATSFIVGNWLSSNPSWAETLTGAGFELANHTWSHQTFASLSASQMADEIGRCRDILVQLTGDPGSAFRPSGTDDGTAEPPAAVMAAAADAGYGVVLGWDVEPFDYKDPGASSIEQVVLRDVAAGSIVSLHFGHPGTITALDPILVGLQDKGLRTVTASELLGA